MIFKTNQEVLRQFIKILYLDKYWPSCTCGYITLKYFVWQIWNDLKSSETNYLTETRLLLAHLGVRNESFIEESTISLSEVTEKPYIGTV